MSFEKNITETNEKPLSQSNYTWNIIFIAIDVVEKSAEGIFEPSMAIKYGIDSFFTDVKETKYSNKLNIYSMQFINDTNIGKITTHKVKDNEGVNEFEEIVYQSANNFNPHEFDFQKPEHLAAYINVVINNKDRTMNKFMVIMLAHSNGVDLAPTLNRSSSLSVVNFSKALSSHFNNDNKLDCLLGINCYLQSINSNLAFGGIVDLLIGSQKELDVYSFTYKRLLVNMHNRNYNNRLLFSKFIFYCNSITKNKKIENEINNLPQHRSIIKEMFSICMTNPNKAVALYFSLHNFSNQLNNNYDEKVMYLLDKFCEDSSSSNSLKLKDSLQFFGKFLDFYSKNSLIYKSIEEVISSIEDLVILNISDGTMVTESISTTTKTKSIFMPLGIGIYVEKYLNGTDKDFLKEINLKEIWPLYIDGVSEQSIYLKIYIQSKLKSFTKFSESFMNIIGS